MTQSNSALAHCAILFAIPVTWEEFDSLARANLSDFVSGMLGGRNPAQVWAQDYEVVAAAAQSLIRSALQLGASVYQKATLAHFSQATSRFQTIVLFAHWRGAVFRTSDFLNSTTAIADRMAQHPLLKNIAPMAKDRNTLVERLNEVVENATLVHSLPASIAGAAERSRVISHTLSRDLIDEVLSGLVAPGNCAEFFDGLHTPGQIEEAIALTFAGELDLALCDSAALGTFIDLRRGDTIHHLHWPDSVHPVPQLIKVERTLRDMALHGGSYITTRLTIEAME